MSDKVQRQWISAEGSGVVLARAAPPQTASPFELVGGADVVNQKYANPGDAPATTTISDMGGFRLYNGSVYILFWGSAWTANPPISPSLQELANNFASILAGPYLSATAQYGCGGFAHLAGVYLSKDDPPNNFLNSDVFLKVTESIDFYGLPFDPFAFYCVVMPPGITKSSIYGNINGNHAYILDGLHAEYANIGWILYSSNLNAMTQIFSHELVEAITDPHGDGIQVNPTDSVNWNEVADVCQSIGNSNGVVVSSYWSQADQACVVPVDIPVHNRQITCIRKIPAADPHHAIKWVSGISVESGQTFHVTQEQCIKDIDSGMHYFVVGADGSKADVIVRIHFPPWQPQGSRYIATVPDDSTADNLLSLPECPPSPGWR